MRACAGGLAIAGIAACPDADAHGGLSPRETALILVLLAFIAGSALLCFLAPILLDRDLMVARVVRGLILGVLSIFAFFVTLQGIEDYYRTHHTTTNSLAPIVVSVVVAYLVPLTYLMVWAWRRRKRKRAE
jgi:hypothetical protein